MALANVVLQSDARLITLGNSPGNRPGVEVDQVFGDSSLVEPQIVEHHLAAEEFGVRWLPLVEVKSYQFHLLLLF